MATWIGDGLVSGYDPISRRHKKGVFHLATTGSIDVNGHTRVDKDLSATSMPGYPNPKNYSFGIEVSGSMQFVASDFNNVPNKGALVLATLLVPDSAFSPGQIPTPRQIYNSGREVASTNGGEGAFSPGVLNMDGTLWASSIPANTRFWLLMFPAIMFNANKNWTRSNFAALGNINNLGRAISVWSNRKPDPPVITSPVNRLEFSPGETFSLNYTVSGGDATTPNDPERANLDLAGVEFEYSAVPSQSDPNPTWRYLPYRRVGASYVTTASYSRGLGASFDGAAGLINDLGTPVIAGVQDEDVPEGHASLPEGTWRIRCRVGDFGHAYPTVFPPFGTQSDWSEPIQVTVLSQTLPPVLVSPIGNTAVEANKDIRFSWLHRSNRNPAPLPQEARWLQVREFGDSEWSTVVAERSTETSVTLPPVIVNPPHIPPVQHLSDPGFENGTTDGWYAWDRPEDPEFPIPVSAMRAVDSTVTVANHNAPALAHSGSRSLLLGSSTGDMSGRFAAREIPIDTNLRDTMDFSLWFSPSPGAFYVLVAVYFADDHFVREAPDKTTENTNFVVLEPETGWDGWINFSPPERVLIPDWATRVFFVATSVSISGTIPTIRIDDVQLTTYPAFNRDSFSFSDTKNYEWRVRTRDTEGGVSSYSPEQRFWVVPEVGSGTVRPVPVDTIDGATLGCGTHRAFIYRRGGKERVGELTNLSSVRWSRVRDDMSTAEVEVSDWGIDCGELLKRLQTWAYELVIYRDNGFSVDRVWEGPITLLTYAHDSVTIQARDVMSYAYRRILKQRMSDAGRGNGTTVVNRAKRVLQNALAPDDPNVLQYLTPIENANDAMQYRSAPAFSRTAYEEVDDMASNAGLDYTVVGRRIILWGTKSRIGTLPEFRDSDLGAPPRVSEYGMSMANVYAVSDGNGVYGFTVAESSGLTKDGDSVSGNDPIYGQVEMLSSTWASDTEDESGTYTEKGLETVRRSFEEFSERSIADRYPPPVVVRVPDNTSLNPDTVLSIQQLVPGVVIPLRSTGTLRTVVADQKLDSVKVEEREGVETISIVLSPFNQDDGAAGEVEDL